MPRLQYDFWNGAPKVALGLHTIKHHVGYGNLPLGRFSPRFSPNQVGKKIYLREIMKPVTSIHLTLRAITRLGARRRKREMRHKPSLANSRLNASHIVAQTGITADLALAKLADQGG